MELYINIIHLDGTCAKIFITIEGKDDEPDLFATTPSFPCNRLVIVRNETRARTSEIRGVSEIRSIFSLDPRVIRDLYTAPRNLDCTSFVVISAVIFSWFSPRQFWEGGFIACT